MKNSITKLLLVGVLAGSLALLASCSSDEEVGAECNHEYGEWTVTSQPTCEGDGIRTKSCKKCQLPVHESVPALGHAFEVTEILTAPTCEEDGSANFVCKNDSSHTKTDILSAIGHAFSDWTVEAAATCYSEGKEVRACANDSSHNESRAIEKTAHALGDYTLLSPATCTENAKYAAECANEGCTYKDVKEEEGTVGEHALSEYTVSSAATCDKNEIQVAHCTNSGCTYTDTKEIENSAIGHRFENYTASPSNDCSKDTVSIAVCSNPNCSATDERVNANTAIGHEYDNGICKICNASIALATEWSIPQAEGTALSAKLYTLKADSYHLSIAGVGAIPDYLAEGAPWHEYSTEIASIDIADTVTSIGDNAFYNLSGISKLVIGKAITHIGRNAFSNCYSLTQIDFNAKKMDDINYVIFENAGIDASGISFTVGAEVESIPTYLFFSTGSTAPNVVSIAFADSQNSVSIGAHSFRNLKSLTTINFTNAISYIDNYAFYGCSSLTEINLESSSVTTIGNYAFSGCTKIKSLIASDSLEYVDENAFFGCNSLSLVDLGDNVSEIAAYAFYKCSSLSELYLGKSLLALGEYAFAECTSLSNLSLPATLGNFYKNTFDKCNVTTTLNGITYIDNWVIGCERFVINVISLKEGVVGFFEDAFSSCERLETIIIPATVKHIKKNAINASPSLKNVYYGGGESDWSEVTIAEDNASLDGAKIYYYSETDPKTSGTHWYYENGEIAFWDNWSNFTSPVIPLFPSHKVS